MVFSFVKYQKNTINIKQYKKKLKKKKLKKLIENSTLFCRILTMDNASLLDLKKHCIMYNFRLVFSKNNSNKKFYYAHNSEKFLLQGTSCLLISKQKSEEFDSNLENLLKYLDKNSNIYFIGFLNRNNNKYYRIIQLNQFLKNSSKKENIMKISFDFYSFFKLCFFDILNHMIDLKKN